MALSRSPRRPRQHRIGALLLALGLGYAPLDPAPAQQDSVASHDSTGVLGRLLDRHTHQPIRGGDIAVVGTKVATTTDSAGRFALGGLRPGDFALEIRAIGYVPVTLLLTLAPRQMLTPVIELEVLPVQLPEVVVKGKEPLANRRFADFERRRHAGMGYFLTQEQIERSGAASLVDVLVTVRGVQQVCLANDCIAKMARSPAGCYPQYFLDGIESTAYFARHTPPGDVRGVEIYRGSSETPGEFQGSNSGCGVIVIWTKSSP
jgi:hypothetical protein